MPEGISGAIPPISVRLKREEIGVKAGDVLDIQIDRSCFLCDFDYWINCNFLFV